MPERYDAILVISFGGPEGMADVMPFLENVTRGRGIPAERLRQVAQHYAQFGGVSPLNEQNRGLIKLLKRELRSHGIDLPVYWGNRNWHPLLADTLAMMRGDGVKRALAFVTSAFSSWSSCRQYLENIAAARQATGQDAPVVDKVRVFYNHPGFIEPMVERVREAVAKLPEGSRDKAGLIFTAHSIPMSMAATSRYEEQLREACGLVAGCVGRNDWSLVYQSRSGPPHVPWLGPDVCEYIEQAHGEGELRAAVIVPIGFVSDHVEVLFDLDEEAAGTCRRLGVPMTRAATVGTHRRFIAMVRELIEERLNDTAARPALGVLGPGADVCPADCCPPPRQVRRV